MRIALLGVGRLGAAHAATLRSLPEVSDLRIHDADAARAREVAARVRAHAVDSVEAALDGADAVVIVTPTDTHAALIGLSLDRGLPVFCEKPIAIGIPETREVTARVRRRSGRLQIGFQRRFDPGYRAAKSALQSGAWAPCTAST